MLGDFRENGKLEMTPCVELIEYASLQNETSLYHLLQIVVHQGIETFSIAFIGVARFRLVSNSMFLSFTVGLK